MKYIALLLVFLMTSCGFTFIPESEYEVDKVSPYVIGITYQGDKDIKIDTTRKTNSSFENILSVTDEEAKTKGRNFNIPVNDRGEFVIDFSEAMFTDTIMKYGVSESIVIIEGEPSRSFLSDMSSPPLSDTNLKKLIKVRVAKINDKQYILDFSDAVDCVTEEDFEKKFCKLKKDTNYTMVISNKVADSNGRGLVTKSDDGENLDENLVILFRTTGNQPTITSVQPLDGETGVCLGLQEVVLEFSMDMNQASINSNTFLLSGAGNIVSGTVTSEPRSAKLALTGNLVANTTYTIQVTGEMKSQSRVNIAPTTFTFTTSSTGAGQAPTFTQNPAATVSGNQITVTWKTNVKSLADVKFGKQGAPKQDYAYTSYTMDHSVTIEVGDPGLYNIDITPKDRCGSVGTAKTAEATILNHPLISEVSPNPSSSSDEFVEIFNAGSDPINLGDYSLWVDTDEYPLSNQMLPAGGYAVIIDSGHSLTIPATTVLQLQDISPTKSDDVFLKYNGTNVDSYTYEFKAAGSSNFSAQRVDVTLRDSDSDNYCEATPTPGLANACQ